MVTAYYRGHYQASATRSAYPTRQAAEHAAEILWQCYLAGEFDRPTSPPVTLGEAVDRFCARKESATGRPLSPSTLRTYRAHLRALLRAARPSLPLPHLAKRHVEAAIAQPKSPASRAAYLRSCRALCRWLVSHGWISVDPTAGIRAPVTARVRPFLRPGEIGAFLAACLDRHRPRAQLILETGLRVGEAVHARWDWVVHGIGRPTLAVPAEDGDWRTKGHRGRGIPLSRRAQEAVDMARERWGDDGFLLHDRDEPIRGDNWHRDTVGACTAADCTLVDTHGLRRTAGILWLASGVDLYTVSRWLGHASVTMTERSYASLVDGRSAAQMDLVDGRAQVPALERRTRRDEGE